MLQIQLVVRAGIETRGLPTVLQIQLVVRAGIEPEITRCYKSSWWPGRELNPGLPGATNPAGGQGGN